MDAPLAFSAHISTADLPRIDSAPRPSAPLLHRARPHSRRATIVKATLQTGRSSPPEKVPPINGSPQNGRPVNSRPDSRMIPIQEALKSTSSFLFLFKASRFSISRRTRSFVHIRQKISSRIVTSVSGEQFVHCVDGSAMVAR